ncbi:methyl-accepting chemotaxis protein [Rhizobium sp. L1K21]|uniref:methyl-accepting chemotaxis protein n=1 Tax=Rhizobium sp. L1K21 TaxID=2954933 RepID=UPI002092E755|nr:methyl-accepting chemotaxis protein [Rhizobium sp. L1K21]MCO6186591.1 methyl-accepting chemotaxis protein [Rhizobium sp. L1K21]
MNLTISRSLSVFGVAVAVSMLGAFGIQLFTLQELKVNGAEYREIVYGKDLVADILPPPLYLIEAYALANEAMLHEELAKANTEKLQQLRKDYEERKAYWPTTGLSAALQEELQTKVLPPGDAFWQTIDTKVVPAFSSSDETTRLDAMNMLKAIFWKHDAAVDKLVNNANAFLAAAEEHAAKMERSLLTVALVATVLALFILLAGLAFFRRKAIKPIGAMADYMVELASGNVEKDVPFAGRSDEVGGMAAAVSVFRESLIEGSQARSREERARETEAAREAAIANQKAAEEAERREVIRQLSQGLNKLAEGDLTHRIAEPFTQQYEMLRAAFNDSLEKLNATFADVADTTATVRSDAAGITGATEKLSKRTEAQAATLEQTAAALEQITTTVRNTTGLASEANTMMLATKEGAENSAAVVQNAIEAMQQIAGSSQKISQIIGVIDEIAFQTNLLALNAGVEAARAGEAGKGFAVVAQEVRELAQRSANAAKEIKVLIETSGSQVSSGVALVNQTGKSLGEIDEKVRQVTDIIANIMTGTREQNTALSEIHEAVCRMDQVTQQNAGMAEETNASSQSMNSQAEHLQRLIKQFTVARTPLALTRSSEAAPLPKMAFG